MNITFEPVIQTVERRADGSIGAISQKRWENHNVAAVDYCVAVRTPCTLGDQWQPFTPTVQTSLNVTWLGMQPVWVIAQFRTADGTAISGVLEDQTIGTEARAVTRLAGMIDEKTPDELQPAAIQTMIAPTRQAFPIKGSVKIANSPCCIGGKVGTQVQLPVAFTAQSPAGTVSEMRIAFQCPLDGATLIAPWEPFTSTKTFTSTVAINFTGWSIAVQYRDSQGKLSPVYCDDVSIEGQP